MTVLPILLVALGLVATYSASTTVLRAVCRHRWIRVLRSRGRDGFLVSRESCKLCGEQRYRYQP